VTGALTDIGLKVTPSVGNFILIHFPDTIRKIGRGRGRLSDRPRLCAARRRRLWPAERAAHVDRHGEANEGVIATLKEFMGTA
jgi:histidinol-phosphate aminotransferase